MAETMTYDPGTDSVTTENNLTSEEKESLQVGEAMEQAQESMLAGKYKDAQELEKAYIELEKKLGQKSQPTSEEENSDQPEAEEKTDTEEDKADDSPPDFAFLEDLYSQASSEKGEISKDLIDKINGMSTQQVVQQFLNWRADAETKYQPISEFSERDVSELKQLVGGEQNYTNMLQWAQSNLTEQEVAMYDAVMERGDINSAFFAVNSLAQRYNDRVGYDGKMLTGNAPKGNTDTFRSQQEMVQAMSDPRYDNDPAYRNDIMEKLARSDMKF